MEFVFAILRKIIINGLMEFAEKDVTTIQDGLKIILQDLVYNL